MGARRFYVITGGTMVHVAPHFSLCAPAYGRVGQQIAEELERQHARSIMADQHYRESLREATTPAGQKPC